MLNAFDNLYEITALFGIVLTVGLGLGLGGAPERVCALVLLLDAFGMLLLLAALDYTPGYWMVPAKSALWLAAYGAASWRWPDRWLILMTGLQGFSVLLHLSVGLDRDVLFPINSLLLNGVGWLMMILLSAASIGAFFKRKDARRTAAPSA